jgi:hypothetical protein
MDERRRKGLCYSYDAKWSRGHVSAVPKLILIEEVEGLEEFLRVVSLEKEKEDPSQFFFDVELEISLNAITETPNPKTMRIVGILKGQQVMLH